MLRSVRAIHLQPLPHGANELQGCCPLSFQSPVTRQTTLRGYILVKTLSVTKLLVAQQIQSCENASAGFGIESRRHREDDASVQPCTGTQLFPCYHRSKGELLHFNPSFNHVNVKYSFEDEHFWASV